MQPSIKEYMDVVNWLNGYRRALFHIQCLEEEIIRWDAKAQRITPSTSSVVSAGSSITPPSALAVEMIEATEERLQEAKARREETRDDIERAIMGLSVETQQKVLYHVYIDLMNLKEVAAKLHYSNKQINRIHMAALVEIKKMSVHVP